MHCSVTPNKRVVFVWESKTRQFPDDEMEKLESLTAERLALEIMGSPPVVALRCLAEVMLNGDDDRLAAVMAVPEVVAVLLECQEDPWFNERDSEYFQQLRERFGV